MSKDRKPPSASTAPVAGPATKGPSEDPQDLQGNDFVQQQLSRLDDKSHEPAHAASPTARKSDAAGPKSQSQTDREFLVQRAARIGYEVYVEDTKLSFRKRDTPEVLGPEAMKRKIEAQAPAAPSGPLVVEELTTMPDGSLVRVVGNAKEWITGPFPEKANQPNAAPGSTARKSDRPGGK